MKRLFQILRLGSLLSVLALAVPIQASPSIQSPVCDYYVDNQAGSDGDGSWTHPWKEINGHLGDLVPGDTMCVRGDVSGSGREYEVAQIDLDSEGGQVRDGAPGSPITVRAYPGEEVILRNVGSEAIVYFRGADYWVFEGFVMDNNGRSTRAVRFKHDASHNILRNNEIHNGRRTGIAIYSGHNVGNVIENNHIHHIDAGDIDAHCIVLDVMSDDTIIRGNVVHDCSGDGIHIYATDDTPISEYSKDVQIVDNVFYRGTLSRNEDGIDIKGADGLVVTGNELYGYHYGDDSSVTARAIVVQKGSRNILFERNVIHDTNAGINCHGEGGKHVENITIKNNLFYNINIEGRYAIFFADVYEAVVYHNTIANSTGFSFYVAGSGLHGGDIRNNLIYNSNRANIVGDAPFVNVTVGYNGWFDTEAESEFTAATDIVGSGDPGFVDASNDDYHLVAVSPARNAGIDVGVTADFEGDHRPFGDHPDIGADEYEDLPTLELTAIPRDRAIHLFWTEFENPALVSYVIRYTYGTGGSDADQGPSPISNIPPTVQVYSLTGVANHVFYTITVAARDESNANLTVSDSVRVMPTDIFLYLPAIMKAMPIHCYYVAPHGNDSNPGTESRPWATVHKAATTAVAGDTVIFEDGTYDVGSGEGGWNSGSSDEPIAFQARNRRQVTWEQSDTGSSVNLDTVSYITFEGLVIRGDNTHEQTALVRMVDCNHVTLDDCEIGESSQAFHGIYIRSCSDVTVTNCSVHPNNGGNDKGDGIHMEGDSSNVTIENCEIYHCDHEGISVTCCDGLLIDNCHIHHTGSHGIGIGGTSNRGDTVADITIKDCSIHDNDTTYDHTGTHHSNVRIHRYASNVTIRRNELYSAACYGLYLSSELTGPIYIYNNTIYNQGLDITTEGQVVFDARNLDNNVQANIYYRNNIVFVTQDGPKAFKSDPEFEPWIQADRNLYYSTSATQSIRRGGTTYHTFAAYQAAGYEPNSVVGHDPLVNDPASADFTLRPGSPAIDAGVNTGEPYSGTAPDIGANEYTGESSPGPGYYDLSMTPEREQHVIAISKRLGMEPEGGDVIWYTIKTR